MDGYREERGPHFQCAELHTHCIPNGPWESMYFFQAPLSLWHETFIRPHDQGQHLAAAAWLSKTHQSEEEGTVFLVWGFGGE